MMAPPPTTRRRRSITFASAISAEQQDELCARILLLEGSIKAAFTGAELDLEYEFPVCSFRQIWQCIVELPATAQPGFLQRLRHASAAFAEHNEQQHCLYPADWQTYVSDIYVRYFELDNGKDRDTRKRLWRRYKGRS